jgi:signal transduction histidine kinase
MYFRLIFIGFMMSALGLYGQSAEQSIDHKNDLAWRLKNIHVDSSWQLVSEALEHSLEAGYMKGEADAYHVKGILNWYQGDVNEATIFFFKALQIRESIGDQLGLARSYNNIGNLYYHSGQIDEAESYYQLGLNMRKELADTIGIAYSLHSLAQVASLQNNRIVAQAYYEEALELTTHIGDLEGQAFMLTSLAEFWYAHDESLTALQLASKALAIQQTLDNGFEIAHNLLLKAKILIDQAGYSAETAAILIESKRYAEKVDAFQLKLEANKFLKDYYHKNGDYESAAQVMEEALMTQEKLSQQSAEQAIAATKNRYEYEKKQLQQQQDLERRNGRLLGILLGIIAALVSIVALVIGYQLYQQQQNNLQLRLKNKALEKSNILLSRFAFMASHDLKEPLRTIGSFSSLIKRRYHQNLDKDGKEYLGFIQKGVHQMYTLLEDLLEFVQPLDEGAPDNTPPSPTNVVVQKVLKELQPLVEKKEIGITVHEMPNTKVPDKEMEKIFFHLIRNAVQHSDCGSEGVEVGYQSDGKEACFFVADKGKGISAEFHDKIFEPFQQLERSSAGRGIGLALTKKIVESNGGRIWVHSQVGEGSCFKFHLPKKKLRQAPEGAQRAKLIGKI